MVERVKRGGAWEGADGGRGMLTSFHPVTGDEGHMRDLQLFDHLLGFLEIACCASG